MTDQASRLLLIESAVKILGYVPTVRAMQAQLCAEGVFVSIKTVSRDYQRLGIRSNATTGRKPTGEQTIKVETRIHVSVYDDCCRIAKQRGVSVAAVLRAMVSKGMRPRPRRHGVPHAHDHLTS